MEGDVVTLQDLYTFDFAAGVDAGGRFLGSLQPTGLRPQFAGQLLQRAEGLRQLAQELDADNEAQRQRLLAAYQCIFGVLAENRIADRPRQRLIFRVALDQVVLGTCRHSLRAEVAVGCAGEHNDRDHRYEALDGPDTLQALRVGKPEVEHDAVRRIDAHLRHRLSQRPGPIENDVGTEGSLQHQLCESSVAIVVLDEQHADSGTDQRTKAGGSRHGRRTIFSQKSSSDRTAATNSVKSTGLVTKQLACKA